MKKFYNIELDNVPKDILDEINKVIKNTKSIIYRSSPTKDITLKKFKLKDLRVGDKIEFPIGTIIKHYVGYSGDRGKSMCGDKQLMILDEDKLGFHRLEYNKKIPNAFNNINTSHNHFGPLAEVVNVTEGGVTVKIQSVVGGTMRGSFYDHHQWYKDNERNWLPTKLTTKKFRISMRLNPHL